MTIEKKPEKIRKLLELAGYVDSFDAAMRRALENQLAHRAKLEKLAVKEGFMDPDEPLDDLDMQMKDLMDECRELYLKKASERKEQVFAKFARIYNKHFTVGEIDALCKLYSEDVWKKMIRLQPSFQQEVFDAMSKLDRELAIEIIKYAEPRAKKIKAVHYAKRAYNRKKKYGASNKEALDVYNEKFKEIMEER